MKIEKILSSFPKKRPLISNNLEKIYAEQYKKIEMVELLPPL
jgi:hypothetical protein